MMTLHRYTVPALAALALAAGALRGTALQTPPAAEPAAPAALPAEEQHLRAGIMLLAALYESLARVQDAASARAAAPEVTRLAGELHTWAQGVSSLPLLSEKEARTYERRYMPTIRRVNDHLRAQGERLAASDYYGSQELASALVSLYSMAQQ